MRRMKSLLHLLWAAMLLAPPPLLACATCFGKSDEKLAQGMNAGIFTLLCVIGSVLLTFAGFFVYLARRAHLQSVESAAAEMKA